MAEPMAARAGNPWFRPLLWPTIMVVVMLPVLLGLGFWQLERLQWKLALIARMDERLAAEPVDLPESGEWAALDVRSLEYRHVRLRGEFIHAREFHYFVQDKDGDPGYDIVTPVALADGGYVFVSRGHVPPALKEPETRVAGEVPGEVTVTGILRLPERRGMFAVKDEPARNIWFVRDPALFGRVAQLSPVAPFFIEADATPNPGGWPKGGQTQVTLRNEHLSYALTWFGLAAGLTVIYFVYHHSMGRIGRGGRNRRRLP
ncbi:MAG: SURF1 family protein [Parvibaculaceae bacterium]|nr:SURF1 family protein [Parvibaculaceae bacterium]